ncbi:MAG: sigma-70 family RNA polymerase sigma factor [Candidatus Veblenbacteria bacterium]|nr:sigma-70 family RNA polymerase sigma factor [Candidatus Veblenbacteria bacterium]
MDSVEVLALVKSAQKKDQAAFGKLYDEYAARIYRFIRFKVPDEAQAEDVLQDTFLKAWQALPKLKLDNLNFSAWLYRIARNLVNDHYRKVYRTPTMEDIQEHYELAYHAHIEERLDEKIGLEHVQTVLPKLKLDYRQVVELRFVQELSVPEVAQIMRRTELAVRILQYRALKKLRGLMT